ncbi:MAG: NAD-dependent epimerase/dehydratase family protein [Candidatus Aminicenantes bacterium]|nr:MAG: NAD-dependent epimerase/dehydratase family protein [Candidatus Aminicenantes bacterium]
MRVFVIGGTGFLGTFLIPKLIESKHEVTALTRSNEKVSGLESLGVNGIVGDLLQPESLPAKIPSQDAVISIAMPEIRPGRISWKRIRKLQGQTKVFFSTSITIAEKCRCPLIVTLGTSFTTRGEETADESWPIERFGIARVGEHVDPLLSEVTSRGSTPLIQMLPGQIYGPGGLFKRVMYEWMKKGKYRVVGSGDNYIPRIHVADCAEAYVKVLEKMPAGERFIIADDGPCTMREFADFMADCMKVSRPKSIPKFVIRIALGKLMYETVTMNCRVCNAKAKKHLEWKLKYPTYREGLPSAIQKLEEVSLLARLTSSESSGDF